MLAPGFSIRRPAARLTRFVSQYWLSLDNSDLLYTALPDGCVDLVLEVTAGNCRSWVYGSTTRPTTISCIPGAHYLGVRFQPGQSRHFITVAAHEITDCHEDLRLLMQFPSERIATRIATAALFDEIDAILGELLCHAAPIVSYVDHVIDHVDAQHGLVRVENIASRVGKSRRQLERTFLQTVGVPLKFFCMISRLRHAAGLIVHPSERSLTAVAHDAGYSDQAHMTRDFNAFFQYHSPR